MAKHVIRLHIECVYCLQTSVFEKIQGVAKLDRRYCVLSQLYLFLQISKEHTFHVLSIIPLITYEKQCLANNYHNT